MLRGSAICIIASTMRPGVAMCSSVRRWHSAVRALRFLSASTKAARSASLSRPPPATGSTSVIAAGPMSGERMCLLASATDWMTGR